MIISCVSEASGSVSESLRTIHFSMSAARIRNRPIRYLDPQQKLILDLRDQIKRLKEENDRLKGTLSRDSSFYHGSQEMDTSSGGGGRTKKEGAARSVPSGYESYGFESEASPQSRFGEDVTLRPSQPQPPPRDVNPPPSKSRLPNQPLVHASSQPTMSDPYSISTLSRSQV
jgi:hypothetical protein